MFKARGAYPQFLQDNFGISVQQDQYIIALAGNPNVGKSTVFNALTGLKQHTGNWSGKTVDNAQGSFTYNKQSYLMIDLPGTYSIFAHTVEEQVARDFICFGQPNVTLVVLDATCLERNLSLALQIMEITPNIIVCVNLMDEARKKHIEINLEALEAELGVPVVGVSARSGEGLQDLLKIIDLLTRGQKQTKPRQLIYPKEIEDALDEVLPYLKDLNYSNLNPRWVALRLLDGDKTFVESIKNYMTYDTYQVNSEVIKK